jgi:cobalt-zinc-cadmium efflux system outer membrane protein
VEDLIQQVLAKNQSAAQMAAAWQAALTKFPQATSRDDPMLAGMMAPPSFGSRNVEPGYRVELSQKLLWPGKRSLRGEMAQAEADAAGSDLEDLKLQLTELTRTAYYDYFLALRAASVNAEALKLLEEFRGNAEARFRTGLIPQQDILQADVEIGKQRERGITLERMRRVAIARINTLMHQGPSEPLGLPPLQLPRGTALPPAQQLIDAGLSARPDLRALEQRIAADRAALALAVKDYWPDIEVAAAYDTIMGNGPARDLAPQVGIRMNLPVRTAKRNAALAEAQAKIAQRSAELGAKIDQVKFQIQESYEQVLESERILTLYEGSILPQANENVKSAQNAYVTGRVPFVSLIEAQRSLVALRERHFEATADYFRRRATLDRLVGRMP